MAKAGRVAIRPRGTWDAATTYERLDFVKHKGGAYTAKKDSLGVEPVDGEYWMLNMNVAADTIEFDNTESGLSATDIQSAINELASEPSVPEGVTYIDFGGGEETGELIPINADLLGGHGAEYFVDRGQSLSTSILEKALEVGNGVYHYRLSGSSYNGGDLPHANYAYGCASVIKRAGSAITVILWGATGNANKIATNRYGSSESGTAWLGWNTVATSEDLSNYLPKSGGALEQIGETNLDFWLRNASRELLFRVANDGRFFLHDNTYNKRVFELTKDGSSSVWNGTASGITGGILKQALTITDTGGTTLLLVGTDNDNIYSQYRGKSGVLGYLGFAGKDNLILIGSDGSTLRKLLHTGNKPTGTYTGNGDATERTINIGGIGEYVAIRKQSSKGVVIVSRGGYFGTDGTSFITGTDVVVNASGNLIVATTNAVFNENGKTYEYTKF